MWNFYYYTILLGWPPSSANYASIIFLHCMVVTELWSSILQLFGVVWVMPRSVKEMLGSWRGQKGNQMLMPIWQMAPLCLMCYMEGA
jgi:hypothetical protein